MTSEEVHKPLNEFDAFETAAEIMAFVFHKTGEDGLRQCLSKGKSHREFLEDTAYELEAVGLPKAAAIVAEFAAISPSEADGCPHEEGTANYKSWHCSLQWHRRKQPNYTERPVR
jgi:hypothetical protein